MDHNPPEPPRDPGTFSVNPDLFSAQPRFCPTSAAISGFYGQSIFTPVAQFEAPEGARINEIASYSKGSDDDTGLCILLQGLGCETPMTGIPVPSECASAHLSLPPSDISEPFLSHRPMGRHTTSTHTSYEWTGSTRPEYARVSLARSTGRLEPVDSTEPWSGMEDQSEMPCRVSIKGSDGLSSTSRNSAMDIDSG
jgi:hypothetical protein